MNDVSIKRIPRSASKNAGQRRAKKNHRSESAESPEIIEVAKRCLIRTYFIMSSHGNAVIKGGSFARKEEAKDR